MVPLGNRFSGVNPGHRAFHLPWSVREGVGQTVAVPMGSSKGGELVGTFWVSVVPLAWCQPASPVGGKWVRSILSVGAVAAQEGHVTKRSTGPSQRWFFRGFCWFRKHRQFIFSVLVAWTRPVTLIVIRPRDQGERGKIESRVASHAEQVLHKAASTQVGLIRPLAASPPKRAGACTSCQGFKLLPGLG